MWRSRSRVRGVTEAHNKGGGIFGEEKAEFGIKKRGGGSRIKMGMTFAISGGLLYASH